MDNSSSSGLLESVNIERFMIGIALIVQTSFSKHQHKYTSVDVGAKEYRTHRPNF